MSVLKYKDNNNNYVKLPQNVGINNVVEGYYNEADHKFYEESSYQTEILGESNKLYISLNYDKLFYWNGNAFRTLGINPATQSTLGGIKVGNGLIITQDGILSVNAYQGDYLVTPSVNSQTLQTSNYVMSDDLEIGAIPYVEVENPEGGETVTIG